VCHDFKQESPFLVITTQHASIFCLSPGLQHNRSTQFTTNFWFELDAVYGTWTDSNRARPPRLAYSVLFLSRALRVKHETSISENLVRDIRTPLDEGGRRFCFQTEVYNQTHKPKKCDFFGNCGNCGNCGNFGNAVNCR
jgi:hypothetical protein